MQKPYSEHEIVNHLSRKNDLRIGQNRDIQLLYGDSAKGDIGIRTRGKLDFLINHCGYHAREVKKYN